MAKRKPLPKLWKTRDGRVLPIAKMETLHLIRSLRMCMRDAKKHMLADALEALSYASGAPDGASYAAEGAANELLATYDKKEAQIDYGIRNSRVAKALYLELEKRKFAAVDALLI